MSRNKKIDFYDLIEINLYKLLENGCMVKKEERNYYNKEGQLVRSVVVKTTEDIPPQELFKIYEVITEIKKKKREEELQLIIGVSNGKE